MRYTLPSCTALALFVCCLAACAARQHVVVTIPTATTVDSAATVTVPAGTTGARVHCTERDTVLEKDDVTVTFVGWRGYRQLGERCGRLQVGAVELSYDEAGFTFAGPYASGAWEADAAPLSVEIDQAGSSRVR